MSTPSIVIVQDEESSELVVLYKHWDGYPTNFGQELADWLKGKVLTQGAMRERPETANGMQDLAAQLVTHFKSADPVGGVYIMPAGYRNFGEYYIYTVYAKGGEIRLRTQYRPEYSETGGQDAWRVEAAETWAAFDGSPKDFDGKKIEATISEKNAAAKV